MTCGERSGFVQSRVEAHGRKRFGGGTGGVRRAFRVVVSGGAQASRHLPWDKVDEGAPVFLTMTDEADYFRATAAVCGVRCGATFGGESGAVDGGSAGGAFECGHAAGERLAILRLERGSAGGGGENPILAGLHWRHVADAGKGLWITAGLDYPRPRVLEPEWGTSRPEREEVAPSRRTIVLVLIVPLVGVLVVLLARGLFHRRWLVIAGMGVGLVGIGDRGGGGGGGERFAADAPECVDCRDERGRGDDAGDCGKFHVV